MISALISLFQGQLTRNDAVFVLVTVGSPVSLYIWLKTVVELHTIWKSLQQWKISLKALGGFFLDGIIVLSLVIWFIMIVLVLSLPATNSYFSQLACTTVYDLSTWLSLM
jgi:hypothetical protein